MSGREMLAPAALIEAINVQGTRNVIAACNSEGCSRLVFCSTYNVVFDGQVCEGGQEGDYDYCPPRSLGRRIIWGERDAYSRTKAEAEQLVLAANSSPGSSGLLHTCAIRPAAIYGEGERRHLPRIYQQVQRGIAFFCIGGMSTLSDWLYVDNLTQALYLADRALADRFRRTGASGRPYFVHDGKPINTFEFLRRIFVPLGFPNVFRLPLSTTLMLGVATLIEWFQYLVGNHLGIAPFLTTAEVLKVGVTHYFSMQSARERLGYTPEILQDEGIARTVSFLRASSMP
eukprot:CAMPEP_0184288560 /NCGR_PEP_ID=MMETSP1049-20130417/1082_1 /TAXON_ID=77928 /ORGANISM="Proteomonas sulcata, Strain CCMP704" /LENGTH=286 /DNA_ID=CAMNT_0026595029 /DNA_START=526 /DNA_END=1386 /DNA_ORIENTATION=+